MDSAQVVQVRLDYEELFRLEFKDSVRDVMDSVRAKRDIEREERIYDLQLRLVNKDKQIDMFKQREVETAIVPVFRWDGFYLGMSAQYNFEDSVLTRQTVLGGMKYDITATMRVVMFGRLVGSLQAGVPVRKEKFYLKVGAEYRVF